MKILSIDIGYVNPAFIILNYENNIITKIVIFQNIKFYNLEDSIKYLEYFFSLNLNLVIIEKQYVYQKNISLMSFIHGFFVAKSIYVVIVSPIALLRTNKNIKTRSAKKKFSVNILNNILLRQQLSLFKFKIKDSDICDAINLSLYYLHKLYYKETFIDNFNIQINKIQFKTFCIENS